MDLIAWIVEQVLDLHRHIHQQLSSALRLASDDSAAIGSLGGVAFMLGLVHALTPGHGKAILFAYFLGRTAWPWAGLSAAAQVAGMHVGAAILLVAAFGSASYILGRPAGAALALQMFSAIAVTAAGGWYVWRAMRRETSETRSTHHTGIAAAAGLLPCPLTMMVLSTALAHTSVGTSVVLVTIMALGIMTTIAVTTTTAIAIQRGAAARLQGRMGRYQAVLRALEWTSALVILFIGISTVVALQQAR